MKKVIFLIFSLSVLSFSKVIVSRPAISRPPVTRPVGVKPKVVSVRPSTTKITSKPTPKPTFKSLPKSSVTPKQNMMYQSKSLNGSADTGLYNSFGMFNRPYMSRTHDTLYNEFEREYVIAREKYKKGLISKETLDAYEKLLRLIKNHM